MLQDLHVDVAVDELKQKLPDELQPILSWFEDNSSEQKRLRKETAVVFNWSLEHVQSGLQLRG